MDVLHSILSPTSSYLSLYRGTVEGLNEETRLIDSVANRYVHRPEWCGVGDVNSHKRDRCASIHMENHKLFQSHERAGQMISMRLN
jgi:hypothetical protein